MPPIALRARIISALVTAVTLGLAGAAPAQEVIKITAAAGHPPIFLWVKHVRESFMPTVDAELAKTGKYKIQWTEAYGGTLAKIGSEAETMQSGVSDVGIVSTVFQPAKLPLNNVTYFVPFGPADAQVVTKAVDYVQGLPELTQEWSRNGLVYLGGFSIDNYGIVTNVPIAKLDDLKGKKIGGAGPNLAWFRGTGAVGVQGSLNTFYNDIKTGVYDGAIAFITSAVPAKLFEVAPNLTQVDFGAMYAGALAVNKARFDKFPDEVKAAFRRGANAYKASYLAEQTARIDSSLAAWQKGGGKITKLPAADQARFIKLIPNPAKEWVRQSEAKGLPAKRVLAAYMESVRANGFKFARDFDKE